MNLPNTPNLSQEMHGSLISEGKKGIWNNKKEIIVIILQLFNKNTKYCNKKVWLNNYFAIILK